MNNIEILVIDDEPQIRKLLKIALESNDYKVVLASTGTEGVNLVANHTPDLVILDLGLPDKSGHLILKDLREWYDKSIIILSVQDEEADIIKALDNGATDYLTKPFRTGELLARIRASLRVRQETGSHPILTSGELEIDLSSRTVKKNNLPIKLTATEYNLISLLAKNQGRVLTHQFLLKEVWGLGSQNETQYLRVFVAQLRKKLEKNPNCPVHLMTESGVGYRFV
ncbi:two-component system KDP operon response regulator KdpE [Salegentibacter sp. 24]|jgi:two-component system KDP operon response regulator KdpE|uniref:response regulator n=1 Tax=Salegentibacter sp. 24 TaxID=2183986 RepID=UPI00105F962E|nr:response regulator transcription factor [Salegentibacter sp. 24]TDN87931.1 two-component system KDP operon response regulator KdpE [Salegentibacter sp. 24]